jgi:uncharacterized membrane protein YecN with MAPEG domain
MGLAFAWIGFYGGILALMAIVMGLMAATARAKTKVSLGDGGNSVQLLKSRRFMNFMEWVPMTLLMMVLAAAYAPLWAVHAGGIALVVGRLLYPLGLKVDSPNDPLRFLGTVLTMIVLGASAIFAIYGVVSRVM